MQLITLNNLLILIGGVILLLLVAKLLKNLFHTALIVIGILIILTAITYTVSIITGTNPVGYLTKEFRVRSEAAHSQILQENTLNMTVNKNFEFAPKALIQKLFN